jgi:hypothetical protein
MTKLSEQLVSCAFGMQPNALTSRGHVSDCQEMNVMLDKVELILRHLPPAVPAVAFLSGLYLLLCAAIGSFVLLRIPRPSSAKARALLATVGLSVMALAVFILPGPFPPRPRPTQSIKIQSAKYGTPRSTTEPCTTYVKNECDGEDECLLDITNTNCCGTCAPYFGLAKIADVRYSCGKELEGSRRVNVVESEPQRLSCKVADD